MRSGIGGLLEKLINPDCLAAAAVCAGEVVVHAGAESYLAEHPEDSPVGQIAGVACVLLRRGDLVTSSSMMPTRSSLSLASHI